MPLSRSFIKLAALVVAAAVGTTACTEEPLAVTSLVATDAAVELEVSSATASVGDRVGVAVVFDSPVANVAGIQGTLKYDTSRLAYVGQAEASATAIISSKNASSGELGFTAFDLDGLHGRVANLVFAVKGTGYAQAVSYDHYQATSRSTTGLTHVPVTVRATSVNATVPIPSDARQFRLADWRAVMVSAGADRRVALRPGDLGTVGLKFGDVNYDGAIGLDDYLAIAFAAVELDELIVGSDTVTRDVDLVMAGNVSPNNGTQSNPACGLNANGSRVLDLDDYLGVAFYAVGLPTEACIGEVIPGRTAAPTLRDTLSGTELVVAGPTTLTLTNDRVWQLDGQLRIQDSAVLVIAPGTRIEGNSAVTAAAVFVERGGKINANGTAYRPIVFTCTGVKQKACWGGVFIAGRGTVNNGDAVLGPSPDGGCNQRGGEGGGPVYGGCNPADNSGSLTYAVIEYAGYLLSANNELNCLTLGAVGSATTIHHVQCHGGSDDGFEFFGGAVSPHHLVASGNDDDGFDVSMGYTGTAQYVIIQADAGAANNDSKAIEADGFEPYAAGDSANFTKLPRTSPKLWNFTIIGNLALRTQNAAVHLRRGSGLRLYNSVIAGYGIGLDIDDRLSCQSAYGDGNLEVRNVTFLEVADLGQVDGSDPVGCTAVAGGSTTEMEEEFVRESARDNAEVGAAGGLGATVGTYFRDAYNTFLPDWRMKTTVSGNPLLGNTLSATGDAEATNFRGAVPAGLGGNIPWYAGWTRPFQSATAP